MAYVFQKHNIVYFNIFYLSTKLKQGVSQQHRFIFANE